MDIKEFTKRIEEIVSSAIKSGQQTEEVIEKEVEKVAKDFFEKSGSRAEEIQGEIFTVVKDVKEKFNDKKAAIGVSKGLMKGAIEGAKLSMGTAKEMVENIVKECISIGLDLKEIPKLLFSNFKNTFFK